MLQTRTYDPGRVAGRAVVWDHAQDRVVCAGDVDVVPDETSVNVSTGSDEVASRTSALAALVRRFPEAVLREATRQLEQSPASGEPSPEVPVGDP